jgi:hypothetical protein
VTLLPLWQVAARLRLKSRGGNPARIDRHTVLVCARDFEQTCVVGTRALRSTSESVTDVRLESVRPVTDKDGDQLIVHCDEEPTGWRVMRQEGNRLELGVDDRDEWRVVLELAGPRVRGPVIEYIYPCATCRWDRSCEEGCHT